MNKNELERLAALQIRGLNQARDSSEVLFLLMKLVEAARILDARSQTVSDDVRKNVMEEVNSRLQTLEAKINNLLQTLENKINNIENNSFSNVTHINAGGGGGDGGICISNKDELTEGFLYFNSKETCSFRLVPKGSCDSGSGDGEGDSDV